MAALIVSGSLSVSLTVPSTQLVSHPLAHAARRHGFRTAHHGIRMEDDGADESSFERVYQQNFESGTTTTAPTELGAEFVGSVVATADISAAAALKQSAKEKEAEAMAAPPLEPQPDLGADLGAATKEIREALAVMKAESEAKAATATAAAADAADDADAAADAAATLLKQRAEQPAPRPTAPELSVSRPELSSPSDVGDVDAALAAAAADAVLRAVASFDRGLSATPADAAAISAAIEAFEEVAPCALLLPTSYFLLTSHCFLLPTYYSCDEVAPCALLLTTYHLLLTTYYLLLTSYAMRWHPARCATRRSAPTCAAAGASPTARAS
jgi:Sec-independent protein translocase protein TatA